MKNDERTVEQIVADKKCFYPGCKEFKSAKGLCINHYNSALRLVKSGKTTWEELDKKGKAKHLIDRSLGLKKSWFLE